MKTASKLLENLLDIQMKRIERMEKSITKVEKHGGPYYEQATEAAIKTALEIIISIERLYRTE